MVNNSIITLEEDGNSYVVTDKIACQNGFYVFLTNTHDVEDICVRKEIQEDGKTFLVGLSSEQEVETAFRMYMSKHSDLQEQ